jgi:hypothetical protein
MRRRNEEAAQRTAQRRKLEDAAPRLAATLPELDTLCLEIQEVRTGVVDTEASYIRRIVVSHAPALFILPCRDAACDSDGHDLTSEIMTALRARKPRFSGEHPCKGKVGGASCQRTLAYVATATYRS